MFISWTYGFPPLRMRAPPALKQKVVFTNLWRSKSEVERGAEMMRICENGKGGNESRKRRKVRERKHRQHHLKDSRGISDATRGRMWSRMWRCERDLLTRKMVSGPRFSRQRSGRMIILSNIQYSQVPSSSQQTTSTRTNTHGMFSALKMIAGFGICSAYQSSKNST